MDALYDAVIGSASIEQIKRTTFSPGTKQQPIRMSGAALPSIIVGQELEPRATFETMDLAGVLTNIGLSGLFISAGTIVIPWNRRVNGGTFSTADNFTLTSANGFLYPTSFGAAQGDEGAVADVECCFLSTDGLVAPVAGNVNQTLSAQAFDAAWAFGPAYLDGTLLSQVVSTKINTGLKVTLKRYNGGVYPSVVYIETIDPSIDITFENFDLVSTYGPLLQTVTSAAIYYRQKAAGGTFTADATAAHIKFSFGAGGLKAIQTASAQDQANGTATIKIFGLSLTATAAHAIP